jgi:hypothetical protein
MSDHSKVLSCTMLDVDDEYLFLIKRSGGLSDVIVHYSDTYEYSRATFQTRPPKVGRNSFVLVVPHAPESDLTVYEARKLGIGIGKIGKLMGALNSEKVWEYDGPQRSTAHDATTKAT